MKKWLCLLAGLLLSGPLWAQQMVLIHGFSTGPATWYSSGFVPVLQQQGWQDGWQHPAAEKTYWLVQLPYRAPLAVQAKALWEQLQGIEAARPDAPVWLVGHSLGAVVARMLLVIQPDPRIQRLISIASPQAGLPLAEPVTAMNRGMGPMGDWMAAFMPGPLADLGLSDALMQELALRPGTALDWLNRQPHPPIRYASIVHTAGDGPWLQLVPPASQDLNNLAVLHGRVQTLALPLRHGLAAADAWAVLQLQ